MTNDKLVTWCRTHDWGRCATEQNGRIHGLRNVGFEPDGTVFEEIISLPADFEALRDWAGY